MTPKFENFAFVGLDQSKNGGASTDRQTDRVAGHDLGPKSKADFFYFRVGSRQARVKQGLYRGHSLLLG